MVVGGSVPNPGASGFKEDSDADYMAFLPSVNRIGLLQWMPLEAMGRLLDDDLAFHVVVPGAADDAAVHGEHACFFGLEFDLSSLLLFDRLVDPELFDMEAVLGVERVDDEQHSLSPFDVNLGRDE